MLGSECCQYSALQMNLMHTSNRALLLQSFSERRRMVCSGVSSRTLCIVMNLVLHASRLPDNSLELL